jgi:ATP-dependent helicase Lhr and Lhr-like helicase
MSQPFYRLAPYIQEHIYRQGWDTLRGVQVKAISAILDTPDHILITSGTASGKTEAAFLPILTQLDEKPSSSIGVLYISPLKALINDQFYRLEGLLKENGMPVQAWHGDVSESKKARFIREGKGVLQITPESLEAMLMKRQPGELVRLFGDLRFVVIDELHAFINSDRGRQVLCQLQRLNRYMQAPARRIGLSATLGEPELAMDWLRGGTTLGVQHVNDAIGKREVGLGLEHFWEAAKSQRDSDDEDDDNDDEQEEDVADLPTSDEQNPEDLPVYQHMYSMVRRANKTLIFANSRGSTEEIIHAMRRIADKEDAEGDEGFYVHHGAVSAPLREKAEADMRDSDKPACVAATVTLELGIDLGSLDQVLQLNATTSVSSFVQRLGRSGRRGTPAQMFFYVVEDQPDNDAKLGKQIPWELVQSIAIVQLYIEEKWIEPPDIPHLPLSLLYHQTMSIIHAQPGLRPPELAERVLSLTPFREVTLDQFRELLRHLQAEEHIQIEPDTRELWLGGKGERITGDYHFYATFQDDTEYVVRHRSEEIGTIQFLPPIGERFALAGRSWRALDIDPDKRVVLVERVKGRAPAKWIGGGGDIHTRIVQRMRRVLDEKSEYSYLHAGALERLREARWLAQTSGLTTAPILPLGGDDWMLLPWCGTKAQGTLELLLNYAGLKLDAEHFYIEVKAENEAALRSVLRALIDNLPPAEALVERLDAISLQRDKFDRYLPAPLLRAAFAADGLDMSGALAALRGLVE